ncbi:MAG: hypothetical protein QOD26_1217 [Betaproteobacteria bacterium]|jgi:hypothetical protein|nr:hypothetical protein [Betaproteobacteria bacterium]
MMIEQLKTFSGKVNTGLKSGGEVAKDGANALYTTAMNNPRTATAVVLGTGVAAALLWLATRNGTFKALHQKVLGRVREAPKRSRKATRAATS